MEIRQADTGRGVAFTGAHEDGLRRVIVHVPSLDQDTPMSRPIANLIARLTDFAGVVRTADTQFKTSARADHLRAATVNVLSKAFAELQGDGRKEKQQIAAAFATALSVDPATPANAHIRQRVLDRWDSCKTVGDKASLIESLSTEGLAALIETDAYREVPVEMQKLITENYIIKRHIDRTGLQSDYARAPSFDDILATGPDVPAAMNASRDALNRLNARSDAIAGVSVILRDVVHLVALCADVPPKDAYNLLVTGKLAT